MEVKQSLNHLNCCHYTNKKLQRKGLVIVYLTSKGFSAVFGGALDIGMILGQELLGYLKV